MNMKLIGAVALAMSTMSVFAAAQGTITRENGETVVGTINFNKRSGVYEVQKGKVSQEVKLDDVAKLDIPKPEGLDRLIQQVEKGQGTAAIAGLQKIVNDYKMLVWDKPAARYLVEAMLASGNVRGAYDEAQKVIADDKTAAYKGALAPAYWQSLLKLKKMTDLEKCLKDAVAKGDRASSAAALVVRGDIIVDKGAGSADSYKQALTDSYLRVALMYSDEASRPARIDAMNRAATCFEKLGQASRAETMREKAKELQ